MFVMAGTLNSEMQAMFCVRILPIVNVDLVFVVIVIFV